MNKLLNSSDLKLGLLVVIVIVLLVVLWKVYKDDDQEDFMAYENNENKPVQAQQHNILENKMHELYSELTNSNDQKTKREFCNKIDEIILNETDFIENLNLSFEQKRFMLSQYETHCKKEHYTNNLENTESDESNEFDKPDNRNEREALKNHNEFDKPDNRNEREEREEREEHFSDGRSFQEEQLSNDQSFQEEQPVESFEEEPTVPQTTVPQTTVLNSNPAGSEVYLILQNEEPTNDLSVYFNNLVSTDRNELTGRQQDCGTLENMDNLSRAVPGAYGILR